MNESVQKWLDELTAAPSTAIQKLVLGYAGVFPVVCFMLAGLFRADGKTVH